MFYICRKQPSDDASGLSDTEVGLRTETPSAK